MHHCTNEKDIINRLSRIEGHIRGIKKMIEEDKECEAVLIQIAAVEGALKNLGKKIIYAHMHGCVADGIKNGDENKTIDDLTKVLDKFI